MNDTVLVNIGWGGDIVIDRGALTLLVAVLSVATTKEGAMLDISIKDGPDMSALKRDREAKEAAEHAMADAGKSWLREYNRAQEAEKRVKELEAQIAGNPDV